MNLLRLWQDDTLHAELESIMLHHLALVKEFSNATTQRKQEIISEIEKLRQQRQLLLAEVVKGK